MDQKKSNFSIQKKNKKSLIFILVLIFLINFSLKIFKITSIPPGATYDEMVYVAESQIILKYGTDASGQWRPWHLLPSKKMYTELTSTALIPGFLIFPNNQILASKFVPVIMGSAIPVLLALIVYYFIRKKTFLFSTAFIATLNPWIFQFSRMGFDSLFSSFFYLLGVVILLYFNKWKKLFALIPFFCGFFQYQGHKVIIVPLIMLIYLLFFMRNFTKFKNNPFKKSFTENLPILLIIIFFIFLSTNYIIRLKNSVAAPRITELAPIDQNYLSNVVIDKRTLAFETPLNKVFTNKATVYTSTIFRKLLKSFDPYILFLRGDLAIDTFSVTDYGFFHHIDLILFALFFILIAKFLVNYQEIILFLLSFVLIGALPTLIRSGEPWITFRNSFAVFGLVMIAGIGFGLLMKQFKFNKIRCLIILIYLILVSSFFYTYFNIYPIKHTLHKGFYYRVLASYINRQAEKKFILVTDLSTATYDYLLTYNNYLKTELRSSIISNANQKDQQFDNGRIKLYENCPENINSLLDENTILVVDWLKEPCNLNNQAQENIRIVSLIDNGTHFSIYGDQLCADYSLLPFVNLKNNFLAVEKLNNKIFCTSFFIE